MKKLEMKIDDEIKKELKKTRLYTEDQAIRANKLIEKDTSINSAIKAQYITFDEVCVFIDNYEIFGKINAAQLAIANSFTNLVDGLKKEEEDHTENWETTAENIKKKISISNSTLNDQFDYIESLYQKLDNLNISDLQGDEIQENLTNLASKAKGSLVSKAIDMHKPNDSKTQTNRLSSSLNDLKPKQLLIEEEKNKNKKRSPLVAMTKPITSRLEIEPSGNIKLEQTLKAKSNKLEPIQLNTQRVNALFNENNGLPINLPQNRSLRKANLVSNFSSKYKNLFEYKLPDKVKQIDQHSVQQFTSLQEKAKELLNKAEEEKQKQKAKLKLNSVTSSKFYMK